MAIGIKVTFRSKISEIMDHCVHYYMTNIIMEKTILTIVLFQIMGSICGKQLNCQVDDYDDKTLNSEVSAREWIKTLMNRNTALILAAKKGQKEEVSLLLENGANVEAMDKDGNTALLWAAFKGFKEIVLLLIENGADIEAINSDGNTALTWAAVCEHREVVALLIENGAKVNATNNTGHTALILAALNGDEDSASFLVKHGANVNATNNDGNTAMMFAAGNANGADVEEKNGVTLDFFTKAWRMEIDIVSLLVEHGANVNTRDNNGETALIWAATFGNEKVASFLVNNGADMEVKDNSGNTALILSARWAKLAVAKLLIKSGANVNAVNDDGNTALCMAAVYSNERVSSIFPGNIGHSEEQSTGLWTGENGDKDIASLLIANGADINIINKYGNTALLYALLKENHKIALFLIKHGADVNTRSRTDGTTALMMAAMNGSWNEWNSEVLLALHEHGADVSAKNNDGHTARDIWDLDHGLVIQ